jgi:hypothetical protein
VGGTTVALGRDGRFDLGIGQFLADGVGIIALVGQQGIDPIRDYAQPRLRFASIEELNGWLEAECRRWADMHQHSEQKELTVAQAWAAADSRA